MKKDAAKKALKLQVKIEKLFNGLADNGFELGIQAAIYLDGELTADVAVGRVSSTSDAKVDSRTLFPVCSTGKGILSSIAHILAERGVIDYEKPMAEYWPEFGANGKETVTVRQALSHQAGLPQSPGFKSFEDLLDFGKACAMTAAAKPEWAPGSQTQYHSRSFGWIIGGLLQKASGKSIGQLLRDEITRPLGIEEDMFFGVSESADSRFSAFEPQPVQREQNSTAPITYAPPPPGMAPELVMPLMDFVNLPKVRRCAMPAVNGIMSAKAIARHYAALMGKVDGARLIPESRLEKALELQTPPGGAPLCFGHGFGLGYVLKGPESEPGAFFGHGGAGGSEGMANRRLKLAIGLTKNRMDTHTKAPDHTCRLLMKEIFDTLGHDGDGGFYKS
jgi:CubicO group peptidase (beta-lactamase class C family)